MVIRKLDKIELTYDGVNYLINGNIINKYDKDILIELNDIDFYFIFMDEYFTIY